MAKYCVNISWDDVPHLTAKQKAEYEAEFEPHMREARTKGFPSVGSGKIYPILESDFIVSPFTIPHHWPRCYALDVGFKVTAVVWGAFNPDTQTWYIYDEYYSKREEPPIHAAAILAKGKWIPGVIDPSAMRGNERDGRKIMMEYRDLGLDPLYLADNAVEIGIVRTRNALGMGKCKILVNCQNLISELRIYRYDDSGRVAKNQDDHACDALRYLINTGQRVYMAMPDELDQYRQNPYAYRYNRDDITGC